MEATTYRIAIHHSGGTYEQDAGEDHKRAAAIWNMQSDHADDYVYRVELFEVRGDARHLLGRWDRHGIAS